MLSISGRRDNDEPHNAAIKTNRTKPDETVSRLSGDYIETARIKRFELNETPLTLNESINPVQTLGGCSLNEMQIVRAALTIASLE